MRCQWTTRRVAEMCDGWRGLVALLICYFLGIWSADLTPAIDSFIRRKTCRHQNAVRRWLHILCRFGSVVICDTESWKEYPNRRASEATPSKHKHVIGVDRQTNRFSPVCNSHFQWIIFSVIINNRDRESQHIHTTLILYIFSSKKQIYLIKTLRLKNPSCCGWATCSPP